MYLLYNLALDFYSIEISRSFKKIVLKLISLSLGLSYQIEEYNVSCWPSQYCI